LVLKLYLSIELLYAKCYVGKHGTFAYFTYVATLEDEWGMYLSNYSAWSNGTKVMKIQSPD